MDAVFISLWVIYNYGFGCQTYGINYAIAKTIFLYGDADSTGAITGYISGCIFKVSMMDIDIYKEKIL